ncbi:hypothetical protein GCM10027566_08020 [Arachidicoccus ginsenosidivorans]|jgi:hypothetical protein|uniref:Uncharacterized protein n=1 Tax=Arachidicoccus ginsenosidivorans TaxID=496057 RepID=A0A5B8VQI8_9BACT|nr:hypothetical protein [Arachidicoccus ginsenosidivorans]QEC73381.1 hypothetical protein FSB73_18645 [Arachidicoccus ginsenosidivorans]
MKTPKTELPRERSTIDPKNSDQLKVIIYNSEKWLEILFHNFSGLLGNINWVTRLMDQNLEQDSLPENTFKELNLTTQHNIYTLKVIQNYIQVLNALAAQKEGTNAEMVMLTESMLLTSIPKMGKLSVQINGLPIKATRVFVKVLCFLLSKVAEVQTTLTEPLVISIKEQDGGQMLQVGVSAAAFNLDEDFLKENGSISAARLGEDTSKWATKMFYEILAVAGGKLLNSSLQQKNTVLQDQENCLKTAVPGTQISQQYLVFSLPYNLEMI